ncbi:MAG: hypothetical protein IPL53_09110 [Ignavibacteria bacterium]|nr:hypothetical protein [Ignavibacteria bacterium]
MEIEHKYYHDAPEKGEKKWKHYALEFFMLFLAITAGFLTENLRDHMVEKERAKEMAVGLYYELAEDSIQISKAIERKKLLISVLSSLIETLDSVEVKKNTTLLTYYQASFLMEVDMPVPANANLDQLINSGSLRYFKNRKLVSDISLWDNIISIKFAERQETDQKRLIEEIKAVNRVFRPVLIDSMRSITFNNLFNGINLNSDIREAFAKTPAKLITYNVEYISEVIGWASERKRNAIVRSTSFLPAQLELIRNLMKDLNGEFDIKKD